MRIHLPTLAAAIIVALEGVAITGLALWQVAALVSGDTESVATAVALLVLSLVGAGAVCAFAVAVLRGRSWGRSGAVVTQVLILAVAGGAVAGEPAYPLIALGLAVPAVIAFVLLIVASRHAGADAQRGAPDEAAEA